MICIRSVAIFLSTIIVTLLCLPGCKDNQSQLVSPHVVTSIAGKVKNAATGHPIRGVVISTDPVGGSVSTDESGQYSIEMRDTALCIITAAKDGYATQSILVWVNAGKTTVADIELSTGLSNNNVPAHPMSPMPADKSAEIRSTTLLRWECSDGDGDQLEYDVYFGPTNPPVIRIAQQIADRGVLLPRLDTAKTYYWMVIAKDRHGGISKGPLWQFTTEKSEPPANALQFIGSNGYVFVPRSDDLALSSGSFTVEAWIYGNKFVGYNHIINRADSSSDLDFMVMIDRGKVRVRSRGAGNNLIGQTKLDTGRWHHIAVVQDAVQEILSIYVDGQFDTSVRLGGSGIGSSANILIGAKSYQGTSKVGEYFNGVIHDVRLWNIACSQQQIIKYMNTRMNGNERGLIAYWPLNEGIGNDAADRAMNNHSAIFIGSGVKWIKALLPLQ